MPDQSDTVALFSELFAGLNRGEADTEATMQLRELLQAVQTTGKKGEMTVTVKIDQSGSRTVTITPVVKGKVPVPDPETAIFYVGEGGILSRDDPYQERLSFQGLPPDDNVRPIRPDEGSPRRVDPETGEIRPLPEGDQ